MIHKIEVVPIVLFLSALMMIVSCGEQKSEWEGTIQEENGVTVVKNPKEPMYKEDVFGLEEELSIGEAEGREEYMFLEVQSIAADDEERIYVLDYKANCVKIYGRNGEFIKKFGREGRGPGEFYLTRTIIITKESEIMVQGLYSLSFFSLEGEFKESISSAKERLFAINIDSEGNIIGLGIVRDEENPRYDLRKFDPKLNYLYSLDFSPLPDSMRDGFNPFFPVLRWTLINGNQVVCGYMKEYELKMFDAKGNLVRKILKDYVPIKVTQEDVEESLEGEELPPQLKERMAVPEYHCPFRWLISDEEGRIFVLTYERVSEGEGYYYDVFDAEGKYIAKVALKTRPLLFKNNKLYTVEEDEEGYQYVKRYKVIWKY
jgi:hypothetical protein